MIHKNYTTYKDTKNYYFTDESVYKKYKTKKEPIYCEDCGHITGYREVKVGIGLLGYEKKKYKKDTMYLMSKIMQKTILNNLMQPNILLESLTKRKIKVPKLINSLGEK